MRRFLFFIFMALLMGCPHDLFAENDSIQHNKKNIVQKACGVMKSIGRAFNDVDTNYIQPQQYKFTTTLMSTYNFESYSIKSKSGQEIKFSPEASLKVGPYIGWSLLFLGYTVDLAYISANKKRELDLSVYTSMLGLDLFVRRSTNDFRIRSWKLRDNEGYESVDGIPFNGLNVSITGLNAYYITNHRKFSYPAVFSQSTCQRRSAGSFMFGGGYTRHSLDLDYNQLQKTLEEANPQMSEKLDSGLLFNQIRYTDISLSAGYGYNWVFSTNWLLSVCMSASLGYKHARGDHAPLFTIIDNFSFSNFNIDGVGRLGVIWNNSKWYFGSYGILHTYNYRKPQFETTNFFGSVYVYIGINFGRKKPRYQ